MRHGDDSRFDRWREAFRRRERWFAAAWLAGLLVVVGALAVTPVRATVLRGLQSAVDRWDERWTRRLAAGEALVAAGDHAEAIAYLERLDRIFPAQDVRHARDQERERVLQLLARSYERLDRRARAMETYDRLIAFDSLNYYNYFERARAAERMLSGWAVAPEARDGYAAALQRFPSHLPSLRGYVDYYMDRGEFIPIVTAYRAYLDAYLAQPVAVWLGSDSATTMVLASGLPEDMELRFSATADTGTTISIGSGGFALRVERIAVLTATRVGELAEAREIEIPATPQRLVHFEPADGRALRPTDLSTRVEYRVPPIAGGIAGVRLRVRLYKPVEETLWALVAKSYRNLLDTDGLRHSEERTVGIAGAELADHILLSQIWAGGGIRKRLDAGP